MTTVEQVVGKVEQALAKISARRGSSSKECVESIRVHLAELRERTEAAETQARSASALPVMLVAAARQHLAGARNLSERLELMLGPEGVNGATFAQALQSLAQEASALVGRMAASVVTPALPMVTIPVSWVRGALEAVGGKQSSSDVQEVVGVLLDEVDAWVFGHLDGDVLAAEFANERSLHAIRAAVQPRPKEHVVDAVIRIAEEREQALSEASAYRAKLEHMAVERRAEETWCTLCLTGTERIVRPNGEHEHRHEAECVLASGIGVTGEEGGI